MITYPLRGKTSLFYFICKLVCIYTHILTAMKAILWFEFYNLLILTFSQSTKYFSFEHFMTLPPCYMALPYFIPFPCLSASEFAFTFIITISDSSGKTFTGIYFLGTWSMSRVTQVIIALSQGCFSAYIDIG